MQYPTEIAELERNLINYPNCSVRLNIYGWSLDTQRIADILKKHWEKNQSQDGYSICIYFQPDREDVESRAAQTSMTPFITLGGEEWGRIIEQAVTQEEGELRYLKLERIGTLLCASFEIGALDGQNRPGTEYHFLLEGNWEGKTVPLQHISVPYTDMEWSRIGSYGDYYHIEAVDLNFDGKQDLLIHEGFSGGSGGRWNNYRALVWDTEAEQFAYYPSFPEQLISLEFDRQRMISCWRAGAGYEAVTVYGVVNGEYVCTRELVFEIKYSEEQGDIISTLSYYEMGELVRTHTASDYSEAERLYPDMAYWPRG